jgi:TetR/AcrR family transcriptional regulator, cholesterol catabolism regulator
MRDIAGEVGVLAGSLYAHIDSKESLLLEIVTGAFERFMRLADYLEQSSEPPEVRLRTAIEEHVRAVADSRERTLVVLHQWRYLTGAHYTRIVAMRRRYEDAFTATLEEGVASGAFGPVDVRIATFTILGVLNWVPEWFSSEGPQTVDEVAGGLADTLLLGLLRR